MFNVHMHVREIHLLVEKCPATGGIQVLIRLRCTGDSRTVGRLRKYRFIGLHGRSFESRNLRRMMQFAEQFPDFGIVSPLTTQLSFQRNRRRSA
jgi:hypothetical protein